MGTSGNVFEILPAPERISPSFLGIAMRRSETRTAEFDTADSKIYQEIRDLEFYASYWRNFILKIVRWKL